MLHPIRPLPVKVDLNVSDLEVAILLCTYNGERYLEKQLDSFNNQTHTNWKIYASDDGSSDTTIEILKKYQSRLGEERLIIKTGPRKGFGKNFLSLINDPKITAHYYAFSDQDDRWHADKLARGISALKDIYEHTPSLYCSRTRLINPSDKIIGYSPLFSAAPSFKNALVQSIAGANTMLINNAARELLCMLDRNISVVAHDWLAYLVVSGCGGIVIYDPSPTLDYRQHDSNLIGANTSFWSRIVTIRILFGRRFQKWIATNLQALSCIENHLTIENLSVLRNFKLARQSGLTNRVRLMIKAGVFRQTMKGNVSLAAAIILKKI
jgi:glycosyltransferase involved in cell wall biosynthesis